MPDVQWTNEPVLPPKPGMSSTAKVAIGCGLLMLLAGGSCVGMVLWGAGKAVKAVGGAGDAEWPVMRQAATQLATEDGTHQLWTSQPGLAHTFTSEDDFRREMANLRPLLQPLPEKKPEPFGGRLVYNYSSRNGFTHVEAGYALGPGATLLFTFENDQLVNIQLQSQNVHPGGIPLTEAPKDDDDSK